MFRLASFATITLLASACADTNAAIGPEDAPLVRAAGPQTCAADPAFVVADEASLHAAALAAQPGDVIAIDGTIALEVGVLVVTEDVTVTCATPGSGLRFTPTSEDFVLISASADRVTVSDLALDVTGGSYAIFSVGTDGQRTERNTITCGDSCGFWVGATNALIADNAVTHPGGGVSGLHFQALRDAEGNIVSGIDGTQIVRNTVTALAPAADPLFGALRPRDGTGVTVARNVLTGPWTNSLSTVGLDDSDVRGNVLEGAQQHGLTVNISGSVRIAFSERNRFIANRVRDAGQSGFLVRNACFNTFRGTPSLGTTPVAFIMGPETGANVVAGSAGPSIDDGAFDCDGDGTNDPNVIHGGRVTHSSATAAARAIVAPPPVPPAAGDLRLMMR